MRTTDVQASHGSVISTTHPRRFSPQQSVTTITALEASDATLDAW